MSERNRYSQILLLVNRWLAQLTRIASGDISDDHEVATSLPSASGEGAEAERWDWGDRGCENPSLEIPKIAKTCFLVFWSAYDCLECSKNFPLILCFFQVFS